MSKPTPWSAQDPTDDDLRFAAAACNAFEVAAPRLGITPGALAEALQDGGIAELVEALRLAAKELNAIRARDGAPQHIDWYRGQPMQTDSCTHEWWNELTERCHAALVMVYGKDPECIPKPTTPETEDA